MDRMYSTVSECTQLCVKFHVVFFCPRVYVCMWAECMYVWVLAGVGVGAYYALRVSRNDNDHTSIKRSVSIKFG